MADNVDVPSTGDKIRYQIDRFLSWSPMARFIGLFAASFILIVICAALAVVVMPPSDDPAKSFDFLEAMWWAMTRVADAGTMGDDEGTAVRFVATLSTLSGVMVVALLIGLVSGTIGDKFDDLRKGHSPVIDSGHTLILGFNEKVFTILRELREANANQKSACVVILCDQEKEEVENEINERMGDMRTTRVVVRKGSPFAVPDLKKVGAGRARSIIVLGHMEGGEDVRVEKGSAATDMDAIKTLLALRRIPGALSKNHAVIELSDGTRRNVVERLGAGGVEVVAMQETLSRMIVQTARQSGLAHVYRDLLGFEGSEIYFKRFPELNGVRFGEVQPRLKNAVALGVRREGVPENGGCTLNPPDHFVLGASDELIVVAEDDDSFGTCPPRAVSIPADFVGPVPRPKQPDRFLICGCGEKLPDVLTEFDEYVLPGSEAWLMPGRKKGEVQELLAESAAKLKKLKLKFVDGDPTSPDSLRKVSSTSFTAALLVADDAVEEDEADARTVITSLLLRELFSGKAERLRIISEILDPRTKDLLEQGYGADFVVSSEITSMMLTQVSERRELNAVFADLFDADGNEIYLKRAACFMNAGSPTPWLAVQQVARTRGEVAIGYFTEGRGPVINPPQEAPVTLGEKDRVIVVAEDEREAPGDTVDTVEKADPAIAASLVPSGPRAPAKT